MNLLVATLLLWNSLSACNGLFPADTVRFYRQELVVLDSKPALVVIDGVPVEDGVGVDEMNGLLRTGVIKSISVKPLDSERYSGMLYLSTKDKNDKTPPAGAEERIKQEYPWKIDGGEHYDAMPQFGDTNNPGAFGIWIDGQAEKTNASQSFDSKEFGVARVRFEVSRAGKVRHVRVVSSSCSDRVNKCILKIVKDSPSWRPARRAGENTPCVIEYPVDCFRLIRGL